ncbi:MAG: hypothetical protein FP820_08330 [Sulfurimonas sp.]|nr:hypothetical protein [Sulfurimonas sp.]MBU3939259.1 hypothetical protein [bacterium]MBU4025362.1 hypothetical protein [bacterium]MBU4059837.1 hypothetical protein [bacterium]MBU4109792.1 hypothetical protein [bacterium]
MIKIILIFLLPISIYASKILSYNIYDRTDRADVMITFDTPYDGVIKQSLSNSNIIIKLYGATVESPKVKKLASQYLYTISITQMSDYVQIVASIASSVKLIASKTSDAYGLRLRFTTSLQDTQTNAPNIDVEENPLSQLPTKKDDALSDNYYIVIIILVIGILILFFIKQRMTNTTKQKPQSSWLFNANNHDEEVSTIQPITTPKNDVNPNNSNMSKDVSIRFQKSIDSNNSVVMLDFADQSYLVLMGKGNILLDKFTDNKPVNQDDFESILKNRHQELDDFLRVQKHEPKEPLQAYKERAASIIYSNES